MSETSEDIRKAAAILMVNLRYSGTETQAQAIAGAALLAERMAERERCEGVLVEKLAEVARWRNEHRNAGRRIEAAGCAVMVSALENALHAIRNQDKP